jgi:hypothetical protein
MDGNLNTFDRCRELYDRLVCSGRIYNELNALASKPVLDLVPQLIVRIPKADRRNYSLADYTQAAEWLLMDLRYETSIDYDMGA